MIFVNIIFWWLVIVFFYILFFQKEEKQITYKQVVRNKQGKRILVRKIPFRW